jgi:hypothetical protein
MEEKEQRILLQISVDGEGTRVKLETHSADDMFNLSLALAQLISQHEILDAGIGTILDTIREHPEFAEGLEENTIDLQAMKEFDNILKN